MKVKVKIPTPLRPYAENREIFEVEGGTVGEVLGALVKSNKGLARHLYTDDGRLRNYVVVYLNDEDIRYLQREATPLKDGDTLIIVPAVAGGSQKAVALSRSLSPEEIKRYSRHLIMPEVGVEGQLKLKRAKVLIVGAGGLGSPSALYLAAAGVGTVGLVDFDVVEENNLQRQVLYGVEDLGRSKLDSARRRLTNLNPNIKVETHDVKLTSENALSIFRNYDVVVDGSDNFPTRYLVNDATVLLGKPNVYGSIFRFEGQASVFHAEKGPCYRCLYPEPPPPGLVPSCAEGGVLGVLPGLIGLLQAQEALKLILGKGEPLIGRLLLFDALKMDFHQVKLRKNPACPLCGPNPTIKGLIDYEEFCGLGGEGEELGSEMEITPEELAAKLEGGEEVSIVDVRNPPEYEICCLPNAKLIPLPELVGRVNELNTADEIVVHCHTGSRSAIAVRLLRQMSFRKVRNLKGGIDAWSLRVDPSLPRY